MEEKFDVLCELMSVSSHLCSLLVGSEIAMNDGDISQSQNFTKQAQNLMSVVIGDTFAEFEENFETSTSDICDYDIPCTLELSRQCSQICYYTSTLISLLQQQKQDVVFENTANLVSKHINTAKQIYNQLFEN